MIIYGSRTFTKVKGVSQDLHTCRQCGLQTHFELLRIRHWFTLFFIPIFPFWVSRTIACPHCGYRIKVKRRNEFEALEQIDTYMAHNTTALSSKISTVTSTQPSSVTPTDIIDPEKQFSISQVREKNACYQGCIAAGGFHTLGLKIDGTVIADGDKKQCRLEGWDQITMVTAGTFHSVGLKRDGTVVTAGGDKATFDDINTWSDIIFIDAKENDTVGLKSDGTVIGVGLNYGGGCQNNGWKNIISVATSGYHTAALRADGTVVAAGRNKHGECNTEKWTDIIAVAAAAKYTIGLRADGTIQATGKLADELKVIGSWQDIVAIATEKDHIVGLKADGTIVFAAEVNLYGLKNVVDWTDIVAVSAAGRHIVGLKSDGTVVAVGKKSDGCNTSKWSDIGPNRF